MDKQSVAILFGGMSPEYEISLQSAHGVISHLDSEKYAPVLIGITRQGQWYRYRGPAGAIREDTWYRPETCTPAVLSPCRGKAGLIEYGTGVTTFTRLDAAFPVMHGAFGEDGCVQGLLALAGIPVVGCGTATSALCMNKHLAHQLVGAAGINVPRAACFGQQANAAEMKAAAQELGYPVFVKPLRTGSSFGISRVAKPKELAKAVQMAFEYDSQILIEEAVEGCEIGCAVLGNEELTVGAPDEIELASGFFDFAEKYSLTTSKIHVPARIAPEKVAEIQETAAQIYRLLGCRGFARVDVFLRPNGEVIFNEVNTIPGFTPHSRYPAMMQAAGHPFPQVIDTLIELAVTP